MLFTPPSMTDSPVHDNVLSVSGIGVYPGSFNPPTLAHIEIALAVIEHHRLDRLDLAVSTVALGKDVVERPRFEERIEVIRASVAEHSTIDVVVTSSRLIVHIAAGYDVVVMGADKWAQISEVEWYADLSARDAALAALPRLALVPRPPLDVPDEHLVPVRADILKISSSAVRAGRVEWMTTAAREFHEATGAWGAD
jgi:nicotinic acid mononucleotide adenylyltransferase